MTPAVVTTRYNKVETFGEFIDKFGFYHEGCNAYIADITCKNRFTETLTYCKAIKTQLYKFKVVAS